MNEHPLRRRTDATGDEPVPLQALVVEDQPAYRAYIESLVSRFGFSVTACSDGAEALAALRLGPGYDLLVVDYEMPRVSGLALISAVRNIDRQSDAYAMMITAREDVETKLDALRLGFDDLLVKSASEAEISAKLNAARRVVRRHRRLGKTVEELYGLATRDELTGLYNRRFFFAETERLLAESTPVNIAFLDLDDFKRVNDTLGHLAGDRMLRDIGGLLLTRTRAEDVVARYGGDEFVMLIAHLSPEDAQNSVARIVADIEAAQWTFGTETWSIAVSTGLACSTLLSAPSVSQLLAAGDRDLYKNKWLRKHPDLDPSVYEYDAGREGHVLQMVRPEEEMDGLVGDEEG